MGVGEELKKERQEEYLENRRLEEANSANALFDRTSPEKKEPLLQAFSTNRLPLEAKMLGGRISADGKLVEFVYGDTVVCGTQAVEVVNELDAPLSTMLFVVESDEGDILQLRPLVLDHRRFRPPAEDEDD